MYSLVVGDDVFIQAHNLPLEGYTQDEIERDMPAVIRTKLPPHVAAILKVDAPVELFCAGGDTTPRSPRDIDSPQKCLLPLICLYTRYSVFHLQLAFHCPFDRKSSVVTGEVVSVTEPFESHLVTTSSSTSIVRVRPAPQRGMGYATMCPPGSVAMLTHDAAVNAYALVLHHGPHRGRPIGWVNQPLKFGLEMLEDDEENSITDFCFAQSTGQPLLATLSVLLLKASGDVLGASPILFDGSVVSRAFVRDAKEYLQHAFDNNDGNEARGRQCFAALQFVKDAFGPDDESPFVTARISDGAITESSTQWPVALQGPVLVSSIGEPDEDWNRAIVIEPFFARDLVGIVIGKERTSVDFAALPATALLPRFAFMEDRDQDDIDSILVNLGALVERLVADTGEDEGRESSFTTLVHDPLVDSMIHYASSRGIVSIKTNAMKVYSNEVRGEALEAEGLMSPSSSRKDETVRSMAWSSLDVSSGDGRISLVGAAVSGDALLGHTLVVSLSDGKC